MLELSSSATIFLAARQSMASSLTSVTLGHNSIIALLHNLMHCSESCVGNLPVPDAFWLCIQCHPTLPVLATSGIEHTVKLWSPEGALAPVDPVDAAVRIRRNQERIMSGSQVLRSISPRVFQVSCLVLSPFCSLNALHAARGNVRVRS